MKKNIFLIILVFLFAKQIIAQDYYFKNYQVEDGLSYNTVTSILQDHNGFMWFGTKDGLNRFDGYSFKVYQNNPKRPQSLGSNFIRSLHEYNHKIWVGTDSGLFAYNAKEENFLPVKISANKPILDIENDTKGNLWFIADGLVFKYSIKTKIAQKVPMPSNRLAKWLTKTPDGKLIIASKNQIFSYNSSINRLKPLNPHFTLAKNHPFTITKIKSLNADTLLIGTKYRGALAYDIKKKSSSTILSNADHPIFVRDFASINKKLWIATESGIYICNLKKGTYQNLKKSYNERFSLTDNAVYALVVDKENAVWIGTYFGGINYYSKSNTPFKKYLPKIGENSISGNAVREIHKDKYGKLWIGTEDAGLNKMNLQTGTFKNFLPKKNKLSLSYYNIQGLLLRGDKIWIGTFEHGLDIMDIKTGEILKHYRASKKMGALHSNFIVDIYESKAGIIYLLTSAGIYQYRKGTDDFKRVAGFPEKYHYSYMAEDKNGTLWAGTYWDGLLFYNPKTGKKGIFKHKNNDVTSLSNNVINAIFKDSSDNLWITTENGLNKYNYKNNSFQRFTKQDGFPSNVLFSILEDDNHKLWVSTAGGLVQFDPKNASMNVYTKANGLPTDQFNYSSAFKDSDGTLYFGSVYGMVSFNPKEFKSSTFNTPILFTGMQLNNSEVHVHEKGSPLQKSIGSSNKIELRHDQSSFSLEFSALNYSAPKMTSYAYKLEGLNNHWINLNKTHKINFTELPTGDYTLKVKSRNSQKEWNANQASLNIVVLPPYYLSTWAYVLYFIFAIGLIYWSFSYYHRLLKQRNERQIALFKHRKEKEVYRAKIEFFTNVAHEIRTPLTLIKGPLEKLLRKSIKSIDDIKENLDIMDKNTRRLLNLVNELLDFRKTETNNLKLSFVEINITSLLKNMRERFKPAFQEKNLALKMDLGPSDRYVYADEEAVKKIVSNLFYNAVKYSRKEIKLELLEEQEMIKIIFKNDGDRIQEDLAKKIFEPFFRIAANGNQGSGIGLSLAHSLAKMHQGDIIFDATETTYNTFIFSLPSHQEKEFKLYQTKGQEPLFSNSLLPEPQKKIPLKNKTAKTSNLLIVEDNKDLLEFISKELQDSYSVFTAENGEKALTIINEQNIQLIISDVKMPIMNGFSFCKIVKENLKTSHIPIILLTAKSAMSSKVEGLEIGADAYIEKPFEISYLKAQARTLLKNRKNIVELYSSSPLSYLKSTSHPKAQDEFIEQLDAIIYASISDPNLNVDIIGEHLHMSRSTLYRKIKETSNLSPNELINKIRLKRAAELLLSGNYKIFEVAERVGYKSQTSFGRSFQKEFKVTPSQFMRESKNK